ncbi:hypothetical protein Tco_0487767 [Tanacetum coccineum]
MTTTSYLLHDKMDKRVRVNLKRLRREARQWGHRIGTLDAQPLHKAIGGDAFGAFEERFLAPQVINEVDKDSEDDEEVCVVTSMNRGSGSGEGTSKGLPKMPRHEGPMDMFFARKPEDVLTGEDDGATLGQMQVVQQL